MRGLTDRRDDTGLADFYEDRGRVLGCLEKCDDNENRGKHEKRYAKPKKLSTSSRFHERAQNI